MIARPVLRWISLTGLLLVTATMLTACGGRGFKQQIFPPSASVQELRRNNGDQWTLMLRLQNFSNVGMHVTQVHASLTFDGESPVAIEAMPNLTVPPDGGEPLPLAIRLPESLVSRIADAGKNRSSLHYSLKGRIDSDQPKQRSDDFEFESSLTPVPGLADTLR